MAAADDELNFPKVGHFKRVEDFQARLRELGVEMTTGNLRMIEEYAGWWDALTEKPALRSYARENAALTALGLPTI